MKHFSPSLILFPPHTPIQNTTQKPVYHSPYPFRDLSAKLRKGKIWCDIYANGGASLLSGGTNSLDWDFRVYSSQKKLISDGGHITNNTRNRTQVNYSITIKSVPVHAMPRRKKDILGTMLELNK